MFVDEAPENISVDLQDFIWVSLYNIGSWIK